MWCRYDESVPRPTGLPDVAERLAELRHLRRGPSLEAATEVVVVCSSSRGGSSAVAALLRRTPGLVTLSAETNPLFMVAGLGEASDDERFRILADEIAADLGAPGPVDPVRLRLDWTWRLTVQWPGERFEPYEIPDAEVLETIRRRHPVVDPRYYDLPSEGPPPTGPPGDVLVEMPPFVVPGGWTPATEEDLAAKPVVLTTPRNSYRLDTIAALFPNARLRVVHLTRNPAAAINGLLDGWHHHGFYNVRMPVELRIDGWPDDRWWCFDIPPAWEGLVDRSLVEVCAEQWRSPHEAVLAFDGEVARVAFEDVVAGRTDGLARFLGVDLPAALPPPVMATVPPKPGRWRARAAELAPVLADEAILELAERLGYAADPDTWE